MKKFGKIPSPFFCRDERGNVAMLFGIMASAAAALMGATIELGRISSAKASLNAAADAAALAAKRAQMENYALGEDASKRKGEAVGQKMFEATRPKLPKGVTEATAQISWDADDSARVVATGNMDLILGMLIGQPTMDLRTHSVATAGSDKYQEIALVLDTTASMFDKDGRAQTRFTQMRQAAKNYVNLGFDGAKVPDRLRFSVIPWTTTVNIKSERPLPWSADPAPNRNVPDYGTRDLPQSPMDRSANLQQNAQTLASWYAPVEWRGCISGSRENGRATSDLPPELQTDRPTDKPVSRMRWDALRVRPLNNYATSYQARQIVTVCEKDDCKPPPPPPPGGGTQGNWINPLKPVETFAFLEFGKANQFAACGITKYPCKKNICDAKSKKFTTLDCWQTPDNGAANSFFNFSGEGDCRYYGCLADTRVRKTKGCTSDYNEIKWNDQGGTWCQFITKSEWTAFKPIAGPNLNCPMPMLGLSGNRKQVIDTIDRLSPAPGGTHGDVGLRWGLRSLSSRPEWTNFFGHTAPTPFKSNEGVKVMILMTDGSNEEAKDYSGYWGCSETSAPGCTTGVPDRAKLDTMMQRWCNEIRLTYKVDLFTIAVNVDDATARKRLKDCVGGDLDRAYSVDASELDATFIAIAQSTFGLRIKE